MQPGPIFAARRLDEAIEYFDRMENIPAKIYLRACKDPLHVDLIGENLKTHDWKAMSKKLKERFPQLSISSATSVGAKPVGEQKQYCLLKSDPLGKNFIPTDYLAYYNLDFKKIIEFFNYNVSSVFGNIIKLEPVYPDSTKSFVNQTCFNRVYHVTVKENVESIEASGLRCKTGKRSGKYREFPKRVYVLGFDVKKYPKLKIIDICKEIASDIFDWDDIAIFECGQLPGEYFYEDTVLPLDYEGVKAMFCYVNIPPEKLKRIY